MTGQLRRITIVAALQLVAATDVRAQAVRTAAAIDGGRFVRLGMPETRTP